MNQRHNSFVIEAEAEEGIEIALKWAEKELEMKMSNTECLTNPDVIVLRYGLFAVGDARKVCDIAASAPFAGEYKVLIISASRAYHEAQNALLKLFEEPPEGTYLFFILPSLGGLLPTLRSRVQILKHPASAKATAGKEARSTKSETSTKHEINPAEEFIKANKEKRSAIIKKLTSGKDEEAKREFRDEAIAIVNSIEAIVYERRGDTLKQGVTSPFPQGVTSLLNDIAILREHLYDRSAPVKMILEHLSLVIPKGLL